MKTKWMGGLLGLGWAVCAWAGAPANGTDPLEALIQSKSPWVLAEQFLVVQETAPVAAHRDWLLRKGKTDAAQKLISLELLYSGDTAGALEALALVKKKDPWTLERESLLTELAEVQKLFVETKSDHFVFRTAEDLSFLAPHALSSLETAFSRSADFLTPHAQLNDAQTQAGIPAGTLIPVELYPTLESYAVAAQMSRSSVSETGAVTCFRFGRVMALSPGATAFGYRWIDGLVHEFVHGQVTRLTWGNAPLWLQEGTARSLEGLGRSSEKFALSSFERALLIRAALDGSATLSAGSGPRGSRTALSTAISVDAVGFLADEFGENKWRELLSAFRQTPDAFSQVLGMDGSEFEKRWMDSLVDLTETPTGGARGALAPLIHLGSADDVVLTDDAVRPLLVQGDKMLGRGNVSAAVVEFKKAVDLEPDNGVALVRLAQVYMKEGKSDAARDLLLRAKTHNPAYAPPCVRLGELHYDEGRYEEAQTVLQEALEINPFDPKIHETLGLIAVDVGNFALARQSLGLALKLDPANSPVREALENMPKPR